MAIQGLVNGSKKWLIPVLILALVLMPVIGSASCTSDGLLYLLIYSVQCGIQVYLDGEYWGTLEFAEEWGYCMFQLITAEGAHKLDFVIPGSVTAGNSAAGILGQGEGTPRASNAPNIKVSYEGPLVDGGHYTVTFGQDSAPQEGQLTQAAQSTQQSCENTIMVEASNQPFEPPPPTQTCTLSVTVTPSTGGSVSPSGGQYTLGTRVTLTATPADGYTFGHWSGGASGSSRTAIIILRSNRSVTAHFEEIPPQMEYYTLTTSVSGSGSISPSGGSYEEGTSVTLTASPKSGWTFHHWGGDALGSSSSTSVTMSSNKQVIGYFAVGSSANTTDTAPPKISHIAASTTETGATITWTTDELASSQVEYGMEITYGTLTPSTPANDPTDGTSIGVTTHYVELTGLTNGTTYYYKVKSKDAAGNEAVSDGDIFTTSDTGEEPVTTPYYGPQLLSPSNGCMVAPTCPVSFSWSRFRASTSYKFQLAKNAAMTDIIAEDMVDATAYEYSGTLDYSTNYFWRVKATAPTESDWSATFSFQTVVVTTPYYGPQLLSPSNGSTGIPVSSVSFSWSPYEDATHYRFVLARDAALTNVVVEADVTTTAYEFTGTLDYSANYFWRVKTTAPTGSGWSATFSFQTESAPTPPP